MNEYLKITNRFKFMHQLYADLLIFLFHACTGFPTKDDLKS